MDPLESTQPNPAETMTAARRDRDVGAEPVTAIRLEIVGGPMDGVTAHVPGDTLVIGRSPQSDLCLHLDPQVSAIHARIVRDGAGYWLEDLASRNGTYVGDVRIRERTLIGPGTLFVLGLTRLEFVPLGGTQSV
jgi:pSer/pThr/pTyr-binding forkhead associated (FHA) protein